MSWNEKLNTFRKIYQGWRNKGFDYATSCEFARIQLKEMEGVNV